MCQYTLYRAGRTVCVLAMVANPIQHTSTCFSFIWTTQSSSWGLIPVLCLGVAPSNAWWTIVVSVIELGLAHTKQLSLTLNHQPDPQTLSFIWFLDPTQLVLRSYSQLSAQETKGRTGLSSSSNIFGEGGLTGAYTL